MPVPYEEASRFGIALTDENNRITEFEEKPEHPRGNLASMGIYIFSWPVLREALIKLSDQSNCDFGKHIIPYVHSKKMRLFAYEFNGYWKDVGTLSSYWEANMELINIIPVFNLYEEYWRIYTKSDTLPPQYVSGDAKIDRSIISEGAEIYGEVYNSVLGAGVVVREGAVVRDSIIMKNTEIGKNSSVERCILAENVVIGHDTHVGVGGEADSKLDPRIYNSGITTIGENTEIPSNVSIGKNVAIAGKTTAEDYPNGVLQSGEYIIKAGDTR